MKKRLILEIVKDNDDYFALSDEGEENKNKFEDKELSELAKKIQALKGLFSNISFRFPGTVIIDNYNGAKIYDGLNQDEIEIFSSSYFSASKP